MLQVNLLGPTEARMEGEDVPLSGLERNLLAVLALSRGMVVSTERIIDCLWGDRHPAAPRSRVQGLVSALRRKIGEGLVTRHPGYVLEVAAGTTDIDRCDELAERARSARSPAEAAQSWRKALSLWRGQPLDGVSAPGIEVDRAQLQELRVGLTEERFTAELEAGRHADVVAELAAAVTAHPLREKLAGQLILALYRCNRQADALKAYQALRDRLADELGSDPCADVRNLHAMILRGDPVVSLSEAGELRPAQLPAGVGHFTGREADLSSLTRAANRPGDEPRVLLVSGPGGLGKTALVVRWAHSALEQFGDGQIFIDLHGHEPDRSLDAGEVLAAVLAALGDSRDDLPSSVDERASRYRTLLNGRRFLIVADDAAQVDQLLPLVPPTPTSQLIATSRRRLTNLSAHHAVQPLFLEPLSTDEAHSLLARIIGPERLREPSADRVLQWCGGWPLAIRIAGTKLASRPWQSLASFADELGEQIDDLTLEGDPRSIRAALASAHKSLSPSAAHLFGRLGLHPSSSLNLQFSATATDTSVRRVRQLFDELVAVHLIVESGRDRYRFHDVVRRFARQCGADLVDRDTVDEWMRRPQTDRVADPYRI